MRRRPQALSSRVFSNYEVYLGPVPSEFYYTRRDFISNPSHGLRNPPTERNLPLTCTFVNKVSFLSCENYPVQLNLNAEWLGIHYVKVWRLARVNYCYFRNCPKMITPRKVEENGGHISLRWKTSRRYLIKSNNQKEKTPCHSTFLSRPIISICLYLGVVVCSVRWWNQTCFKTKLA